MSMRTSDSPLGQAAVFQSAWDLQTLSCVRHGSNRRRSAPQTLSVKPMGGRARVDSLISAIKESATLCFATHQTPGVHCVDSAPSHPSPKECQSRVACNS